jgi:hypothetical protein
MISSSHFAWAFLCIPRDEPEIATTTYLIKNGIQGKSLDPTPPKTYRRPTENLPKAYQESVNDYDK